MRASIIIPTYNRLPILKRCLECLANQENVDLSQVEVLVVDDGSTDGTTTWLEEVVNSKSQIQNSNEIPNPMDTPCFKGGKGVLTGENQVQRAYPFSLRHFHQENKGQGNARNLALDHATGEIIFFIGDDILFEPNCLAQHLAVHEAFPDERYACLGFTTWHHELPVSNFMYFLEHGGHQFAYHAIRKQIPNSKFQIPTKPQTSNIKNKKKDSVIARRRYRACPEYVRGDDEAISEEDKKNYQLSIINHQLFEASFWFFYTSNVSVKASLINGRSTGIAAPFGSTLRFPPEADRRNDEPLRFAPVYTSYGWEDTEFGYRLERERGMKLLYNPAAKAEHHHVVTIEGFENKMRSIAKNALIFHDRFPEVPVLPNAFKRFVFRILSLPIVLWKLKLLGKFSKKIERLYFYALMKKYWMAGVKST